MASQSLAAAILYLSGHHLYISSRTILPPLLPSLSPLLSLLPILIAAVTGDIDDSVTWHDINVVFLRIHLLGLTVSATKTKGVVQPAPPSTFSPVNITKDPPLIATEMKPLLFA